MIPSLAGQSSTSLFRNIIERGWGMFNYESYNKSLILLQIEASSYWYNLPSIAWHWIIVPRTHLTHFEYSYYITPYEPRFECPPKVNVNLGAEGSIGRWNLLPHMRSKQGNDKLIFGALFQKPLKTLIEPAQPKSDIGRLSSAQHRSCFSFELAQQIRVTET